MTTQKQVNDVLLSFIEVHKKRRTFLSSLAKQGCTERFRVLIEALVHHQTRIIDGLINQTEALPKELLQTWFKNPPDWPFSEMGEMDENLPRDQEFEKKFVPELILQFNKSSMRFLESARFKIETPELAELFSSLIRLSEQECLKQWQMTQSVEEL